MQEERRELLTDNKTPFPKIWLAEKEWHFYLLLCVEIHIHTCGFSDLHSVKQVSYTDKESTCVYVSRLSTCVCVCESECERERDRMSG